MKQLNIFELQNSIDRKKQHRNSIYESVLHKCHLKIKTAAHRELYEVFFDVPQYVVGLPLYNINNCLNYIMEHLENNGFKVTYMFPKLLKISWYPSTPQTLTTPSSSSLSNHHQSLHPTTSIPIDDHNDPQLFLNYIPYKNEKGKFVLNID